jgi:hypothetical protein
LLKKIKFIIIFCFNKAKKIEKLIYRHVHYKFICNIKNAMASTKAKTPCRHGKYCHSFECPYGHGAPSTKDKKLCMYGVGCNDQDCKYLHDVPFCSVPKCSVPCCGDRHVKKCRYGSDCKSFDCEYRHLGVNWCHPSLGNCEVGKIHCIYHPNI